ncbi:MAG: hypothetical protein NVS4B11_15540 [Ktedonobacteraceae bacterium]
MTQKEHEREIGNSSVHGVYVNMVEHAIHRLNDAARRIAAVEQSERRQPRASRLAPLRDISADIQRQSTPLPKTIADAEDTPQKRSTANELPDLWPWLPDTDDVDNNNAWENYTDPLLSRRIPNSAEAARIEAEDERRARAEGVIITPRTRRPTRTTRLRIAFVSLAILAILALTIDTALISVAFLHPHHTLVPTSGPPTLTITSQDTNKDNKVIFGQRVTLRLMHFKPSTTVYITHDVGVPVILSTGIPVVRVGKNGAATASTVIAPADWGPGFHNVEAEDINSHYTAIATLQVVNAGPSKPSHLIIKNLTLDMGSNYQGSNTIQPFVLSNDENASGAITWAASSNKPWLMLAPNQGTFSNTQNISIGVERGTMVPGTYNGKITFSSNVGAPIVVQVQMEVKPLPPDAGAILMIAPAVLSFTASDGAANSNNGQKLTISNLGRQVLSWSLANNPPTTQVGQNAFLSISNLDVPGLSTNWLNTDSTSGTVPPGGSESVNVTVNSQNMLPGAYTDTLVFSSPDPKTINATQSVSISLTVQPHCSLTLSTGGMSFNAVSNSSNASNQALNVGASSSCSSAVPWRATSSMNWLTITPSNGVAKTVVSSVITVGIDVANMGPGTYVGTITIVSMQDGNTQGNTQTVTVVLTVQPPPLPGTPVMAAAPLTMSFSTVQGQPISSGQTVLITNSGQSALLWHTAVSLLANMWLNASPTGGTINPGQTATMTISAVVNGLTPGTYNGQVALSGYDAKTGVIAADGSPQNVAVQLQVNPPCALVQPSASALAFTAVQGGGDPTPQAITLTASGNCTWPLGWNANVTSAPWLKLSPRAGIFGQGGLSTTLNISPHIMNLQPGTYTTQVTVNASDTSGLPVQGSPQVFSATLTVQAACKMSVSAPSLSFTVAQGQTATVQNILASETGTCARPVTWTATGDAASTNWLVLSPASGSDTGSGATVGISVNATSLPPNTYNASVTLTASNGALILGSPQTISVAVTVTGFSISGAVDACSGTPCTAPTPLPAAAVILTNSAGAQVATTTADANGNYSFSNVGLGTYTIAASGTNSNGVHYAGTLTIPVTGNMPNTNLILV